MKCTFCGQEIPKNRLRWKNVKYCHVNCRRAQDRKKYHARNQRPHHLNTGTVGAMHELKVAIDLLSKGYEVFRALSSMTSCDLAILKDKKLKRIEVRTAAYSSSGSVSWPKHHKADILAAVLPDKIIYTPNLSGSIT